MADSPDLTVRVQRDGDDIRISPVPTDDEPHPLLRSALDVAGGLLEFRVADLDIPPSLLLTAPDAAASWLDDVYGEGTSAAVDAVVAGAEAQDLVIGESDLRSRLARLSLGSWIRRWWPQDAEVTPLDDARLDIELAALAWECDAVFLDRQPAGELLAKQSALLSTLAIVRAGGARERTDAEGTVLRTALEAAVLTLPSDNPDMALLDELFDRLTTHHEEESAEEAAQASVLRLTAPARPSGAHFARDFALAAQGRRVDEEEQDVVDQGSASVDWVLVEPRHLDWGEDTIRWTVRRRDGENSISISVAASPMDPTTGPPTTRFFARLYPSDSHGIPIAIVPLALADGDYRGETTLTLDVDPADLLVEVYTPSRARPPLSPVSRDAAAHARRSAQDLIQQRSDAIREGTPFAPLADLFLGEGDR